MFTYSSEFLELIQNHPDIIIGSDVHGADLALWEKGRSFIASCIDHPGIILDYGCANGFLLRCLQEWTGLGHKLIPYGIDTNQERLDTVRTLFPDIDSSHFERNDIAYYKKLLTTETTFDYIYWNVWDNMAPGVNAGIDSEFLNYLMPLITLLSPHGRIMLGFYLQDKAKSLQSIDYILQNLLTSTKLDQLKLNVGQTIQNPTGNEVLIYFDKKG